MFHRARFCVCLNFVSGGLLLISDVFVSPVQSSPVQSTSVHFNPVISNTPYKCMLVVLAQMTKLWWLVVPGKHIATNVSGIPQMPVSLVAP